MSWFAKDFEEKMTPFIDNIYKDIFKEKLVSIKRSSRNKENDKKLLFMDINLAIDTHLTFNNGSIITFQEKTLRYSKISFNQFTFEYYNDPKIKDEGEWFKLAAQMYFFGYANKNETGYEKYFILNVAKLRTALLNNFTIKQLEDNYLRKNPAPAKANFFAIPFSILKNYSNVVVYEH